jgi:uncharacterized membrane protein YkvA (DUF1232 family)
MSTTWLVVLGSVVALTVALAAAFWWVLRSAPPEQTALAKRVRRLSLRNKGRLAIRLMRDGRVPLAVRAIPAFLVLYLAMPLDLIPDFIPVIGHLDDVVIVGLGIGLLLRVTPREALEDQVARLEPPR